MVLVRKRIEDFEGGIVRAGHATKAFQDVGGYENIDKLGISVACAYDSKTKKFLEYREKDLPKLFELCEERLIVGYNIRGFDLPVMAA